MYLKYIEFLLCFSFAYSQWTYEEQDHWIQNYPACGGTHQSPININSYKTRRNPYLRLFLDNYLTARRNVVIRNTGHTAEMSLNASTSPIKIGVGPNSIPYIFQNMHFHWGTDNEKGSEHSLNNYFGSAEVHFVHYKQSYGNISEALKNSDGIVVLAVVFDLSRQSNPSLSPIMNAIPQIINFDSSTVIPQFNFATLLPSYVDSFFSYNGSLTTPPCAEAVTFKVFTDPLGISPYQLSQFRRLLEEPNHNIVSNKRSIQPLNDRVVEESIPYSGRK